MPGINVSVLIVAHNEEHQIADCIKSGRFADEIVVILDRSTDQTAMIAEKFGVKLIKGAWPDEGDRRNTGIEACAGNWILELDADENLTDELVAEITNTLPKTQMDYFIIPFKNFVGGKYVKYGWGAYNGVGGKAALFRKGMKTWHSGTVHPKISLLGKRGEMGAGINHFVDQNLTSMYERLNRYSSAAALDAVTAGLVPTGLGTFRRFFSRFLQSYFFKRGYREGYIGLALAMFSAMYPVLTYFKAKEILGESSSDKG